MAHSSVVESRVDVVLREKARTARARQAHGDNDVEYKRIEIIRVLCSHRCDDNSEIPSLFFSLFLTRAF